MEGRHPMGKDDDMKQTDLDNMQGQNVDPNTTRDQSSEDLTEEIDDY
jgi:hypothetical protein